MQIKPEHFEYLKAEMLSTPMPAGISYLRNHDRFARQWVVDAGLVTFIRETLSEYLAPWDIMEAVDKIVLDALYVEEKI